jgi:hypothetical protein
MHWAVTRVQALLEEVEEERDDLAGKQDLDLVDTERLIRFDGKIEGVEAALAALREGIESEIDSMAAEGQRPPAKAGGLQVAE